MPGELAVPMPTPAQLKMMAANFQRRAAQFSRLALEDPDFAKGSETFRRLAEDCRAGPDRPA